MIVSPGYWSIVMGRMTISFGILLILVGIIGFLLASLSEPEGMASLTALIPSVIGLLLAICGALAMRESMRMHAMHAAAVVAVLSFLAILGRMIPSMTDGVFNGAVIEQLITAIILLVFIALCVKSFIDARRSGSQTT